MNMRNRQIFSTSKQTTHVPQLICFKDDLGKCSWSQPNQHSWQVLNTQEFVSGFKEREVQKVKSTQSSLALKGHTDFQKLCVQLHTRYQILMEIINDSNNSKQSEAKQSSTKLKQHTLRFSRKTGDKKNRKDIAHSFWKLP